jgi:hypothetical protein
LEILHFGPFSVTPSCTSAHFLGMTMCAWCHDVIERPAGAQGAHLVSHGICRGCLTEELAKLRPTVAPTPLFALQPAAG